MSEGTAVRCLACAVSAACDAIVPYTMDGLSRELLKSSSSSQGKDAEGGVGVGLGNPSLERTPGG